MLIDKGFSENDIVSLKLVSGEEIISRYVSENNEEIKIANPRCVTFNGNGIGLIPWVILGEKETISIKKSHVLVYIPSKKEAAQQYLEATTGIAIR